MIRYVVGGVMLGSVATLVVLLVVNHYNTAPAHSFFSWHCHVLSTEVGKGTSYCCNDTAYACAETLRQCDAELASLVASHKGKPAARWSPSTDPLLQMWTPQRD